MKSIVERKKSLKQAGFKIKCSNLFISQRSFRFLLSGIILKSPIIYW